VDCFGHLKTESLWMSIKKKGLQLHKLGLKAKASDDVDDFLVHAAWIQQSPEQRKQPKVGASSG